MGEFKANSLVSDLIEALGLKNVIRPEKMMGFLSSGSQNPAFLPGGHSAVSEALRNLASHSSSSSAFLENYQKLKDKNVSDLDNFILLLSKVHEHKPLQRLLKLGIKVTATDTASITSSNSSQGKDTNLEEIKEQLNVVTRPGLSLTGKSSQLTTQIVASFTPVTPLWFKELPYLTTDFPGANDTNPEPLHLISSIPVSSQEQFLIEDMLAILNGWNGRYIKARPLLKGELTRQFIMDETAEPTLLGLCRQILPLASHHSQIERFIETRTYFEAALVNHALAAALKTLMKDYRVLLCQLETLCLKNQLTLQKMWFALQPTIRTLELLQSIVTALEKAHATGAYVLSLLHQRALELMGESQHQQIVLYLAQSAAVPYLDMLSKWIYKGIVHDPYGEFLVEDHERLIGNVDPQYYSDGYWEKRYSIRRDRLPVFLETQVERILRTGKYLNVIRQCGHANNGEDKRDPKLTYTLECTDLCEALDAAYSFSSQALLKLLMNEYDLMGRLKSVKHYFLLDSGDFICQFLDLCEDELCKVADDVVPSRLISLLELALRTSTANADAYKDDLGLDLLSTDVATQITRILSIQTHQEKGLASQKTSRTVLTGLEAFSFTYQVKWPVSLILTTKVQACYQMLFRHLFYAKWVERRLCRVGLGPYDEPPLVVNAALALRHRMLHFVQHLEYYTMVEVLEPNWHQLALNLRSVANVDDVIATHQNFLNVCLTEAMFTRTDLMSITNKILDACVQFANCMDKITGNPKRELYHDQENEMSLEDRIARLDLEFTTLVGDLLRRIASLSENPYAKMSTLLHRLNFNDYYSKKMVFAPNEEYESLSG